MTYVITQPCIDVKDKSCVDVCPVSCIHLETTASIASCTSTRMNASTAVPASQSAL